MKYLSQLQTIYDTVDQPGTKYKDVYTQVKEVLVSIDYQWPEAVLAFSGYWRASQLESSIKKAESFKPGADRLCYPPDCRAKLGRCNWDNEPLFYCATDTGTPIFEIEPKQQSVFTLSKWTDKDCPDGASACKPVMILPLIIGLEQVYKTLGDRSSLNQLIDYLRNHSSDDIQRVDEFLGEKFAIPIEDGPKNLYFFTSAVAHFMFNDPVRPVPVDALVYPSVASEFTGVNLAIKPEFVNRQLKLQIATTYRVMARRLANYSYLLRVLHNRVERDGSGNFRWQDGDQKRRWKLDPSTTPEY